MSSFQHLDRHLDRVLTVDIPGANTKAITYSPPPLPKNARYLTTNAEIYNYVSDMCQRHQIPFPVDHGEILYFNGSPLRSTETGLRLYVLMLKNASEKRDSNRVDELGSLLGGMGVQYGGFDELNDIMGDVSLGSSSSLESP
ncbi:hypothetical protein SAICODRAFT_16247 [Saitoella complicata NRRL Y-17804]|nr:uncharacterized protein SAICODRAFT_16247 [Saitoella complicata NRRL Y-17804]ODQ56224.1 hypothetical protein SAICODRAFT_16247 [Saitoella complicata NRRL Y-17804]